MKHLLFLALIISGAVWGKTYDLSHRFGVGGGAGASIPLGDTDFNDDAEEDFSYNIHARYHTHKADSLQLSFINLDFEDTDIGAKVYDLMYLYRINEVDRFTPVLGLGAGVADLTDFDPHDNLKLALRARAGFEYALSEDLFAGLVVDYHFINKMPDDDDGMPIGEMHVLAPQLNLTLYFGHDKEESDSKKKKDPAPAVASVDTDQDGVIDAKDKCPGTLPGNSVNAYGCMASEKAEVRVEVFFDTGSSKLTLNSSGELRKLADFLTEHPGTKMEIQGHTDSTGSKTRNRSLSTDRANAVKVYLVEEMGVSPSRLTSYGYGAEEPIADNSTAEGRAKNRRVMAVITE